MYVAFMNFMYLDVLFILFFFLFLFKGKQTKLFKFWQYSDKYVHVHNYQLLHSL